MPNRKSVFISYSHDSPEHVARVLTLANQLVVDGIDCKLDQYEVSPPEGWPRWTEKQLKAADFVLLVCTEHYYKRVVGEESAGVGRGVQWESHLIYQHIYENASRSIRFIPVLFDVRNAPHIPTPLRGVMFYRLDTPLGYEELYRRITDQPQARKPPLGPQKILPERAPEWRLNAESPSHVADGICGSTAVELTMILSRQDVHGDFVPLPGITPTGTQVLRDMAPIVASSKVTTLRTGDRIQIELISDRPGYLKAFNIGASGKVNPIFPLSSHQSPAIEGHKKLLLCEVEMTPPAGRERICAAFSQRPLASSCEELADFVVSANQMTDPRGIRDMIGRSNRLTQLSLQDISVVIWDLEHIE